MQDRLFRLVAALALAMVVATVGLTAFGFLCAGIYLALSTTLSPTLAALLTAVALLLLAALTALLGALMLRRPPKSAAAPADPLMLALAAGDALAGSARAGLSGLGRRGLAVALAAGFVIGFSPPLRRALAKLLAGRR